MITFDDVPGHDSYGGTNLPPNYYGLNWTNALFINATNSNFVGTGYPVILTSGDYVGFFRYNMSMEPYEPNTTFTFNSCIMAVGWTGPINLTIIGYISSIPSYSAAYQLTITARTIVELNWPSLNKVSFFPTGPGILDTGFENLCITF